jgi:UDP-N-acetylmuramoyl-L-alanine---L-glutamate ligase
MISSPTLEALVRCRVGILGYGREGQSAVRALQERRPDADLTVLVESGEVPGDLPAQSGTFDERLQDFDVLLRSPGVPVDHPALIDYRARGGQVVNPGSVWFAERAGLPVIGVTGSKGKSTTASLLAHLLGSVERKVLLAGNIGVPLLDHLHTDADVVVLEMSSYQLADIEGRLEMGVITRLFAEHLDWHGSLAHYVDSKLRIARLLEGRPLLVNGRDPVLMRATTDISGRVTGNRAPCVERRGNGLFLGGEQLADSAGLPLLGQHNLDNMALAIQACILMGVPASELVPALAGFQPLPHRLEPVAEAGGVRWINDSIATSPHATLAALEALGDSPVVLIAGGMARPADWSEVIERCRRHELLALVTLPDNGEAVAREFEQRLGARRVPIHCAGDIENAVGVARELSRPGSVVLLSPGAPSFPHFRDFEERGRRFAAAARMAR